MKYEWRKRDKELYLPKETPTIQDIPAMNYIAIDGIGNPNQPDFTERVQALYTIAYGIKMSYRKDNPPKDYYEYTVFPLEGVWDLIPSARGKDNWTKEELAYTIMIRQPEFLDEALFIQFQEAAWLKTNDDSVKKVYFKTIYEGPCVQCLHIGSYDDEKRTFAKMDEYVESMGYKREDLRHREIYIGDPRKSAPEKLKTTLRYKIEKKI